MYCKKCGAYVDDNAKFCNACGANTQSTAPAQPKPQTQPKPQQVVYTQPVYVAPVAPVTPVAAPAKNGPDSEKVFAVLRNNARSAPTVIYAIFSTIALIAVNLALIFDSGLFVMRRGTVYTVQPLWLTIPIFISILIMSICAIFPVIGSWILVGTKGRVSPAAIRMLRPTPVFQTVLAIFSCIAAGIGTIAVPIIIAVGGGALSFLTSAFEDNPDADNAISQLLGGSVAVAIILSIVIMVVIFVFSILYAVAIRNYGRHMKVLSNAAATGSYTCKGAPCVILYIWGVIVSSVSIPLMIANLYMGIFYFCLGVCMFLAGILYKRIDSQMRQ